MNEFFKIWEQLIYENEMESASNVEDVTVAQIGDRLIMTTTPLQKF